jgi:hypothetical protein
MPLPCIKNYGAKQCTAKSKRTKQPCKNPAAFGCKVCRLHGARKAESIKRGKDHPNYKHGKCSLEVRDGYKKDMLELKKLNALIKKMLNNYSNLPVLLLSIYSSLFSSCLILSLNSFFIFKIVSCITGSSVISS